MKASEGAFNQEKALILIGAFSVYVKTDESFDSAIQNQLICQDLQLTKKVSLFVIFYIFLFIYPSPPTQGPIAAISPYNLNF